MAHDTNTRVLAHYVVVHSPAAPIPYLGWNTWPWTTGALALTAFAVGVALSLAIEWTIVERLPAVQTAKATHQAELRHAKYRVEAQARLGTLNERLAQLGGAIRDLETSLRDEIGLSGNGARYEDFETPAELDRLMVDGDTGVSDAWERIEGALLVRPKFEQLTRQVSGLGAQDVFEAGDIDALDAAIGEAQSAFEQVRAGKEAAKHLSVLLQVERLRSHIPTRKEP